MIVNSVLLLTYDPITHQLPLFAEVDEEERHIPVKKSQRAPLPPSPRGFYFGVCFVNPTHLISSHEPEPEHGHGHETAESTLNPLSANRANDYSLSPKSPSRPKTPHPPSSSLPQATRDRRKFGLPERITPDLNVMVGGGKYRSPPPQLLSPSDNPSQKCQISLQ